MTNPIIIIPARMASTRLPGKPLADINGTPMIVHVWRRATEAGIGPVTVACAEADIATAITDAGGHAMLTRPDHPSGTDRIYEALQSLDPAGRHDVIINLQGDLPTLDANLIHVTAALLEPAVSEISTVAAVITDPEEITSSSVVKAIVSLAEGARSGRALYFSRNPGPSGAGPLLHHIGIYGFRRAALDRFVSLAPSPLEGREKLEQLRALEHGMRIDVGLVDTVPLGVDTSADLDRARAILSA
jgi:3-deoxy-manno-octulosonate cytidylyltransferase (CMP-KDO synthetase)